MYDDLIKRLQEDKPSRRMMLTAADAIEKLSAYARQFEDLRRDGYYLQKTKMMTDGQAIMTMPLPEPPKEK